MDYVGKESFLNIERKECTFVQRIVKTAVICHQFLWPYPPPRDKELTKLCDIIRAAVYPLCWKQEPITLLSLKPRQCRDFKSQVLES